MTGIFEQLEKLINEHGSANILSERLALAADQYAVLEKKAGALESEVASLRMENANLKTQIEATQQKAEFRLYKSIAFKQNANGHFSEQPFCPKCHNPMSLIMGGVVRCAPCMHTAMLENERLPEIAKWLDENPE